MIANRTHLSLGKQAALVAMLALVSMPGLGAVEDRMWLPAKINGKPIILAFDTGAELTFLFRETAERLGLRVTNADSTIDPGPGRVIFGTTETCELTIWNHTEKTVVPVFEKPRGIVSTIEGVVGWRAVKENIIRFDATTLEVEIGMPTLMQNVTTNWLRCEVRTNVDFLEINVPDGAGESIGISIDTGSENGIGLNPKGWSEWLSSHPKCAKTLNAYFMPGAGLVVTEVAWADKATMGNLTLTDTPISEANSAEIALGSPRFGGTLGIAALRRMDFVVDSRSGVAYLRPLKTPPAPFNHNRIGAVFVPADVQRGEDLIAHVLDGTPASEAGIRNGDILQKIDSLDVTAWRSNPAIMPLSRFFEQPPGARLTLTLKRGEKSYQADMVLRDLIGPKSVVGK